MEKKVRYVKIPGIIFLLCSIGLMVTALIYGPSINTVSGIVIFFLSVCYLVNPPVIYTRDQIILKNMWGMTIKAYTFKRDAIRVHGDTIYVNGNPLRLSKTILVRDQYEALLSHINARIHGHRSEPIRRALKARATIRGGKLREKEDRESVPVWPDFVD